MKNRHNARFVAALCRESPLYLGLAVASLAWLWPVGLGGHMPVGGDVTRFQMGLMAFLQHSWEHGRWLPVWNPSWGWGFPGLAESQMGTYYPPHWGLYGLLSLEQAYTASMVFHTIWGAWGTAYAARVWGQSRQAAGFAGLVFLGSGFFVIHLTHQWGYSTASWMPWAWGLAQRLQQHASASESSSRSDWAITSLRVMMLACVLAVTMLYGHFQLAFCTQVSLVALAAASIATDVDARRRAVRSGKPRTPWPNVFRRGGLVIIALVLGWLLAAAQLIPTARLAALAQEQRSPEYLAKFSATPWHLVSYVAPHLFHVSPLWRPVIWDPWETSPEEHLAYVGLAPLALAAGVAVARLRRRRSANTDADVKTTGIGILIILFLLGLILSLGPYVPGFRTWCQWPGFSFFRAPARWSLVSTLALALLAGHGADRILTRDWDWRRIGRGLTVFALASLAWIATVAGVIELAWTAEESHWEGTRSTINTLLGWLPVEERPTMDMLGKAARTPRPDSLQVESALARQGITRINADQWIWHRQRWSIYKQELTPTFVILFGLLAAGILAMRLAGRKPKVPMRAPLGMVVALGLLTAADLAWVRTLRGIDTMPTGSLVALSPVLNRLAQEPTGTRVIGMGLGNLPLVSGTAAVSGYRTLDLPAQGALLQLARESLSVTAIRPLIEPALRVSGIDLRLIDPVERIPLAARTPDWPGWSDSELIDDPHLTAWLHGQAWAQSRPPAYRQFALWRPVASRAPRAWLIPLDGTAGVASIDDLAAFPDQDPGPTLRLLDNPRCRPLPFNNDDPSHPAVDFPQSALTPAGPYAVLVSQLWLTAWRATWRDPSGDRPDLPATTHRVLDGWLAVPAPDAVESAGRILVLDYDQTDIYFGLAVSIFTLILCTAFSVLCIRQIRISKNNEIRS